MLSSGFLLCLGVVGTLGLPTVIPNRPRPDALGVLSGALGVPTVIPGRPPCQESQGSEGCWKYGVFCVEGEAIAWDDWGDCNKCSYQGELYEPGETFSTGAEDCACPQEDGVNYGGTYRDPVCTLVAPVPPTPTPVLPTTVSSCQPWSQAYGCWVIGGACIHGQEVLWTDWSRCPNWLKKKVENRGFKVSSIETLKTN
ncbi:PREDICTED: uncharacterized protein LOC109474017 [Branchiostoma belcheri]|uniref:Uncharacterized protein LOC109474017 n=1 Tax=Branchiostoma belcheri TaxID=7741 RepID=A0A6P4ZJJ5_BRABE|nr:PREDICTED: uncharacterized protein LOC109474017 [Branchiostoma belcheri]